MEEVSQIQDDAVSSNDLNSSNLLNNLAHWDVGNMASNAFSEIYTQEGDDDDVLPFEALLDTKSNDATNNHIETPWIDGSSSSCDNIGTSLACVERDDFQVLQSLGVMETSSSSKYILGANNQLSLPLSTSVKESSLTSENTEFPSKIQSEVNSNAHVIFLNSPRTTRQLDQTSQFNVTVSRTTFENCVKNIKNNFINDNFGQNSSRQGSLFDLDVDGADIIQKSFETSGRAAGNLSVGDAMCIDGPSDVFGADESSNSFLDGSNHSTAESTSLQTQYGNQLIYADLSGAASKDSTFQNNSALFLNSLHLPRQQHIVISSEGQQKIILQNQPKPHLLKQLAQQPSASLNQHFILHQTPTQVVSPQLHTVFQQLKMPQQIIRTTLNKNQLENTSNLLSGHIALNKLSVEEQGSNLIMANIKSTKPPRNRNQVNRSGRTDATVGGKPNTTGPTNEKDSQELERVMNILKHYKQQIASNDQDSQFLPCKRKRSKPPESICTSANSINNLSKLVTTAVIPNLNLSFNLSIKSNDSKSDNLISNSTVKANSDLGSLIVSNPEQMNIYAVSNSATKMLATSAVQTVNSFVSTQANVIPATKPLLAPSCSQNFPFPLQLPVSSALGRAQSLLNSLQNNTPTTLQLSFKNLTKLVGLSSGTSPTVDKILSNEIVQTKVIKSLSSSTVHQINSQTQSSQQQIHNVSQALITLHQLNSSQKLSNSQQIFINSLLQKNLPQLLQLSVRHSSTAVAQSSAVHSISQNIADVSINPAISSLPSPEQTEQASLSNRGTNQLSDSFKTSKVSAQLPTSNHTASINATLQMNSAAQSLKNGPNYSDDLEATIDDTQASVELPTVDSINSSVAHSQNSTQSGDVKLNAVFSLSCNKVKLELNKKLKASPLSRLSTTIASTSPPMPVKNVQQLDRRPGSSAPSYSKIYADNNTSLEVWPNKIDEDVEKNGIISSVFGGCKSLEGVKNFLKKSFKAEESAIRIEKLKKAESKNDANSWDPTPKSILKRIGPEEKILCLVAAEEASDDEKLSIIGLVLWEGIEEQLVNTAFDCLFTLFQVETDKKRKSRSDKNSNTCNAVWNLNNKDLVSLKLTSLDILPKQQRVKESCDVIHQLARKVSKSLSQLLEEVCQNENLWTEATLLSNNSEEFSQNTEDVIEIFCYVPLKCRTTDDNAKSRRDLGIWRVFPGCVLSKTDEESSQKKTNSNRNRLKLETQGNTFTDQEHFTPDVQPRLQTNESKKLKNQIGDKVDKNDALENDDFWTDKTSDSSTNRKKRKLLETEPTLKLKIKKISSEDRNLIEADDTDQGTDDGKPEKAKHQHYYCVRPRRQKSQRQIEHEQLQEQQRMTRNSNSRGRQRQQRSDENSVLDGKSKGLSKSKDTNSKVDQDCKSPADEVSKMTNTDTRNRLTMKLRDKISPRTSYASGVFMALTQGSIYLEVPKQNFNSTSLTNCSTNQLCLRLCRRKPQAKNESQESKSTTSSPVRDFTELSDLIKQENGNLGSTGGVHFVKSLHEEDMLTETNSPMATLTYCKDHSAMTAFAAHATAVESQDISSFGVISNPTITMYDLPTNKSVASDIPHQPVTNPLTDFLQLSCEGSTGMPLLDMKIKTYTAAPVNCAITMTTDTLVTKWIKPKLATTGPYPCWD